MSTVTCSHGQPLSNFWAMSPARKFKGSALQRAQVPSHLERVSEPHHQDRSPNQRNSGTKTNRRGYSAGTTLPPLERPLRFPPDGQSNQARNGVVTRLRQHIAQGSKPVLHPCRHPRMVQCFKLIPAPRVLGAKLLQKGMQLFLLRFWQRQIGGMP